MKKLLLFTTLPMIAFLSSFAGKNDVPTVDNVITDSAAIPVTLLNETSASGYTVEMNPMAVDFVASYKAKEASNLNRLKSIGKKHLDVIDNILDKYNVPAGLKYLSIIESNLNFKAVSWAGARGPWQLMPATARVLGLRVSKGVDERTNLTKSTTAAAKYLNELFGQYKDWLLVIAAYNAGPGNVNKAIRKAGTTNFWKLQKYLPTETRNHVKKFVATHYILEGDGSIATMTKAEAAAFNQLPTETDASMEVLTVTGKYSAEAIAANVKMTQDAFEQLNPAFNEQITMNGTYNLRLPAEKMENFRNTKTQILDQTVRTALAMIN